jgi:hypothetical protein
LFCLLVPYRPAQELLQKSPHPAGAQQVHQRENHRKNEENVHQEVGNMKKEKGKQPDESEKQR